MADKKYNEQIHAQVGKKDSLQVIFISKRYTFSAFLLVLSCHTLPSGNPPNHNLPNNLKLFGIQKHKVLGTCK
jgi:hypothetical protein